MLTELGNDKRIQVRNKYSLIKIFYPLLILKTFGYSIELPVVNGSF